MYATGSIHGMAENLSRLPIDAVRRIVDSSSRSPRQLEIITYAVFRELDQAELFHSDFKTVVRVLHGVFTWAGIDYKPDRPKTKKRGWPLVKEVDVMRAEAASKQVFIM